jgi:4-hydroxy-2-oxoheptanedioate aldolase
LSRRPPTREKSSLRTNHTLSLLRARKVAVGLWLHTHSFHVARILAAQGMLDWLLLDLEHTPVDSSAASMILATIADVSGGRCTPLVRVSGCTMEAIKHALDAGAQGVLVPMVSTPEDAAAAVRFARYPPDGCRGAGGLTPHLGFGVLAHGEYVTQANREILVAIQIEEAAAIENIDAIVAVPGIDLIFVGPVDLHLSLGLAPALWSGQPAFLAAINRVATACRSRDIPMGTLAPDATSTVERLERGFTFLGMGTDVIHLVGSVRRTREAIAGVLGER